MAKSAVKKIYSSLELSWVSIFSKIWSSLGEQRVGFFLNHRYRFLEALLHYSEYLFVRGGHNIKQYQE